MFNLPRLVFINYIPDNKKKALNINNLRFTYEFLSSYLGEVYIVKNAG